MSPRLLLLLCILALAQSLPAAERISTEQRAFFETKIRPVLVAQCYECHSRTAKKLGGKLLLDSQSAMLSGGESGPALIAGQPDESLLLQALRYDGLEMPPKQRLAEPILADFAAWIKMGAPDPREELAPGKAPAPAAKPSALWSLQPRQAPQPPTVQNQAWSRDPLDTFILAKLEAAKLKPAADAPRTALIRRLSFDLTGLPPTAEQMQRYSRPEASPVALVEDLLASPHYGERWGRHWLDVARYAESNGNDGLSRNASFPHAWRYRDYVIAAFNDDTPYDRFITEQLAGDLLPAATPAERDRLLTATGLMALGAKPAKAMNDNFDMDVVADQIALVGSGIMGLTVGCARCHDHKTDPIPTRDYYALAGIFRSSETLWGAAAMQGLTAPQTALHQLSTASGAQPRGEIEAILKANPPHRPPAKPAHTYPAGAALAMGLREAKAVADCKLNIDGDSKKLGPAVPRGFVTACGQFDSALVPDPKQSGRLQLARWLTHPQHPLTARVLVNRVWLRLFGEGIVRTADDFGTFGEKPTHPELLDHLATRFIEQGWSVKRLIRDIVLSRTYQLSTQSEAGLAKSDAESRMALFGQHRRRRLDAEELRDAMLAATGSLERQPAHGSLIQQRDVLINELPPLHQPSQHRSIYLLMLRNSMPPELTPFNLPDAVTLTGRRDTATLTTQSLYLLNNAFVIEQAQRFAKAIQAHSDDSEQRLALAYQQTFARQPTQPEVARALNFLREAEAQLVSSSEATGNEPRASAWDAFCQALLVSSELRYVD